MSPFCMYHAFFASLIGVQLEILHTGITNVLIKINIYH